MYVLSIHGQLCIVLRTILASSSLCIINFELCSTIVALSPYVYVTVEITSFRLHHCQLCTIVIVLYLTNLSHTCNNLLHGEGASIVVSLYVGKIFFGSQNHSKLNYY